MRDCAYHTVLEVQVYKVHSQLPYIKEQITTFVPDLYITSDLSLYTPKYTYTCDDFWSHVANGSNGIGFESLFKLSRGAKVTQLKLPSSVEEQEAGRTVGCVDSVRTNAWVWSTTHFEGLMSLCMRP